MVIVDVEGHSAVDAMNRLVWLRRLCSIVGDIVTGPGLIVSALSQIAFILVSSFNCTSLHIVTVFSFVVVYASPLNWHLLVDRRVNHYLAPAACL